MKWRGSLLLASLSLVGLAGLTAALPRAAAQGQGASAAQATPGAGDAAATASLPMPVDEIIRRFAQHESDFKVARDNYTYTQEVLVEDVSPNRGNIA